jgi:hypothetical protein
MITGSCSFCHRSAEPHSAHLLPIASLDLRENSLACVRDRRDSCVDREERVAHAFFCALVPACYHAIPEMHAAR